MRAASAVAALPSQTDGAIAFQRNDDAHGEIWLIDPNAAAPASTPVTGDAAPQARPAWGPVYQVFLPDGSVSDPMTDLAYQRHANGNWDIWRRTTPTPLPDPTPSFPALGPGAALVARPGNQEQPAFSDALPISTSDPQLPPSLLAYISDETGGRELWLRDATGALNRLTSDGSMAGYANPDFAGRFRPMAGDGISRTIGLTFESTRNGQRGIWALDIDVDASGKFIGTHDLRPVALGPEELSEPSWQVTSPNQVVEFNDVAFTTREAGATYLDYVEAAAFDVAGIIPFLDPAKSARYQLTGDPGGDSGPVWAPFGDRIAFTRAVAGNADIWVMSANGANPHGLTTYAGPDVHPSWQPAQESSADIVGGHTSPGPVTRTRRGGSSGGGNPGGGNPGGGNPGGGNPRGGTRGRRSPRLAIRSARWHAGRVTVAGRAARGLPGRVRVAFACGRRRSQHTQKRVRARSGRFAARLRAPRACRRARRGTVVVAYGGDHRYRAQRVSRRVRRR